jgi:hypothetical protein
MRNLEAHRRLQQATEQSPRASICRLSNQLDIPRTTVCRVLHFKLEKRAYHIEARDYLNNNFRNTWIGRTAQKHWAPHSPDLTPLDFFIWGFIKPNVYKTKVPDFYDLRQYIYEAAQALTPKMLYDVFRAALERWKQCLKMEGGQVELYSICYTTVAPVTYLTFIQFGKVIL